MTDETGDADETSDTDKIPVAQRTEVERKPRIARTIRVLALPIVVIWLLIAVGVLQIQDRRARGARRLWRFRAASAAKAG